MEDVFNIISKSINSGLPSGIYNMGGGKFQSIRELIETLFDFFDVLAKILFWTETRRDGNIRCLRLNAMN